MFWNKKRLSVHILLAMISPCSSSFFLNKQMSVSVRRAARRYGLREAAEGEDWTLFWTDCSVSLDRVKDMKRYQVLHTAAVMLED